MKTGTIKFYLDKKGYGFIAQDDEQKDIFFHIADVKSDKESIQKGAAVEYEVGMSKDKREKATNITIVS